jgi:hypothetical protein
LKAVLRAVQEVPKNAFEVFRRHETGQQRKERVVADDVIDAPYCALE